MEFKFANTLEREILESIQINRVSRGDEIHRKFQNPNRDGRNYCEGAVKTALENLINNGLVQILLPPGDYNPLPETTYYIEEKKIFYKS
jgi:hypothetical protein